MSGWKGGRVDGWKGGWMDGRESGVKDCLQQSKMVNICVENFKSKILSEFKLNNGGQFYKKT